ncbi:histidinol phosphatase-like enzyme (inositol monophosphatase family) [Caulobacter ginsengisoli]|uniref:Histidinol-phosphatase n=1 Tax=Caulobacter ginsengisoli TaxID=400775 RepID=A0ABU0IU09_9CAUL|nr:histidinol-phosphatase [Caulobacter ginsengisoli]MDQ0464519.1 histidinol phosphatase-like enzyme (inositol monophosphatase family) [Caulobacter ginsengisoli]
MLQPNQLAELDAFLVELNRASSAVILPLFRGDHGLEDKGGPQGFDPVTEADRGAEAAIRKLIAERHPEHGVIGEEYGEDRPDAEFVWVLDPVDGTRAFVGGLPLWTTLIGLRFQGRPVLGSIGQPYLGELYIGSAAGSRLMTRGSSQPLKTRPCPDFSRAIIATTDPEACFNPAERQAWRDLRKATRLARLGCDAYAYAMVAAGTMDVVVESGLKSWDVEAAMPVIEGAGGFHSDWKGQPIGQSGGTMVLAGDRAALDATVAITGLA